MENGADGALGINPTNGKAGGSGPTIAFNTANQPPASNPTNSSPSIISETIYAEDEYGLIISSVGGNGGNGGSNYLSTSSGANGGNGGPGGNIELIVSSDVQKIETLANYKHGITAVSRSGQGGQAATGF